MSSILSSSLAQPQQQALTAPSRRVFARLADVRSLQVTEMTTTAVFAPDTDWAATILIDLAQRRSRDVPKRPFPLTSSALSTHRLRALARPAERREARLSIVRLTNVRSDLNVSICVSWPPMCLM